MNLRYKILTIGTPNDHCFEAFSCSKRINGGHWTKTYVETISSTSYFELYYLFFDNECVGTAFSKNIHYICLKDFNYSSSKLPKRTKKEIRKIIETIKPDLIHIFGTERPYTNFVVSNYSPSKIVVAITGLISKIYPKYYAGIGFKERLFSTSLFELFFRRSLAQQKRQMMKRAGQEIEAIKKALYICGRTGWDKKTVLELNKNVKYFFCNEVLNEVFYENSNRWNYNNCRKHTIFLSGSSYPIKGLHIVIDALKEVKKEYPDSKLIISGESLSKKNGIINIIKRTGYSKIIGKRIKMNGLVNDVVFTGSLDSHQMVKMYLNANCFVVSSIIENSCNSLGEAMLLGTPCIASNVGGIESVIGNSGVFIYDFGDYITLAKRIKTVFELGEKIHSLSARESEQALRFFSKADMENNLKKMYFEILKNE